jgi:hypothetical protein
MATNDRTTENTEAAHVVTESDYQRLYEESKAENERLKVVMTAARINGTPSTAAGAANRHRGAANRVRAVVGDAGFHQMSRAERLTAVGCDPTISDEFLKKVYGRGNNGAIGRDLHRTDPEKYALLREASLILNIFAN